MISARPSVGLSGRPRRATIGLSWFTKKCGYECSTKMVCAVGPNLCEAGIRKIGRHCMALGIISAA